MEASDPSADDVIANLAINAILLHELDAFSFTPEATLDYLTLDSQVYGAVHHFDICCGFSMHNMVGCAKVANCDDLDGNGIMDLCDTAWAGSADANANGIPDSCERDCNEDDIDDTCQLANHTLEDLNVNGYPDDCEPCVTAAECCDIDPADGIRDDNCIWCECNATTPQTAATCTQIAISFADMGGAFGACPPDTFCNVHDRNHALDCFSGTNPCDTVNIDAGGAFGACPPDGFCNIHDANHALSCFAGTNPCTCPPGPSPEFDPVTVGDTPLVAVVAPMSAGDNTVDVRVFTGGAMSDLRSYQLDVVISGGTAGAVELIDIAIEPLPDFVFASREDTFESFNVAKGQMLCGLDIDAGVATPSGGYLATYTYHVSADAAGDFVVDFRHDEPAGDQTFLVASSDGRIEVSATTPGVIITTTTPATVP